jgi:phage terminase large subunit
MPDEVLDIEEHHSFSEFYDDREKQRLYHESGCKFRAQIGGMGGGKTFAQIVEALRYCLLVPGCDCLIIRRTFPDLEKSVIRQFLKIPEWVYGGKRQYNNSKHVVNFPNGSKLTFGYCEMDKDVNQYLSTEYVFIGLEEAGEFSFAVWMALARRNRCPIKFDINGQPVRPSMSLATNPINFGFPWIKKLFVLKEPYGGMSVYNPDDYFFVHSTVYDNPTYANDQAYIANLEMGTEADVRKNLFGDMDEVSGAYFSNFNPKMGGHVVPYNELKFQTWHPRWAGFDYGFAPQNQGSASVILWAAKVDVMRAGGMKTVNCIYREEILYHKTEKEIAARMRKVMQPGEQLANIFFSHEQFAQRSSVRTTADQLGDELIKLSLPRLTRSDTDRTGGWKLIYNLFASDNLVIADTCPQLIGTIPILAHDPDKTGDILKKAGTVEDDIADAFRYTLKGYLSPGKIPQDVEKEEYLSKAKNNTQKYMMDLRWQQAHKGGDLVVPVPRRKLW